MRSVCFAIAFLVVMLVSQGCGGRHRFGYPWDVPGPSQAMVAEHARTHKPLVEALERRQAGDRLASSRGVAVPVGFRTYEDGFAIVDVLLYRPKVHPYWSADPFDDLRRLKYFYYNGMTAFNAVDGVGYIIKRCDGRAVGLRTQELANPPDAATRDRYGIIPDLIAPAVDVTAEGAAYVAQVLPVVIRCREPIQAGDCLVVRLDPAGPRSFDAATRDVRLIAAPAQIPQESTHAH